MGLMGGGGGGGWARRYSQVYVVTLTAQHSADKQWLFVPMRWT